MKNLVNSIEVEEEMDILNKENGIIETIFNNESISAKFFTFFHEMEIYRGIDNKKFYVKDFEEDIFLHQSENLEGAKVFIAQSDFDIAENIFEVAEETPFHEKLKEKVCDDMKSEDNRQLYHALSQKSFL